MAKRRLNKQQTARIAANQAATLVDAGEQQLLHGLITSHHGKEVEVIEREKDKPLTLSRPHRCHLRANLPTVVCGDHVLWRHADQTAEVGIVEALEERLTVINRPRPYQDPKPIAANIDQILLVIAAQPEPVTNLVDRYLIAAENAGIEIALLINKTDQLCDADAARTLEEINTLIDIYDQLGYNIYHYCCGDTDRQIAVPLHSAARHFEGQTVLSGKNTILVGQSGVGKSSIINTLCGQQPAATGDVSKANAKGRHTTTTSQLYFVDTGQGDALGSIIDSPGIREFALWHLTQHEIIDGLREFREHASQCRFRDCEHGVSQGCALQQAFDSGAIHPSRVASYKHILNSLND